MDAAHARGKAFWGLGRPIQLGAQAVFDRQTHPLPGDVGGMVGCGWVKSPT